VVYCYPSSHPSADHPAEVLSQHPAEDPEVPESNDDRHYCHHHHHHHYHHHWEEKKEEVCRLHRFRLHRVVYRYCDRSLVVVVIVGVGVVVVVVVRLCHVDLVAEAYGHRLFWFGVVVPGLIAGCYGQPVVVAGFAVGVVAVGVGVDAGSNYTHRHRHRHRMCSRLWNRHHHGEETHSSSSSSPFHHHHFPTTIFPFVVFCRRCCCHRCEPPEATRRRRRIETNRNDTVGIIQWRVLSLGIHIPASLISFL